MKTPEINFNTFKNVFKSPRLLKNSHKWVLYGKKITFFRLWKGVLRYPMF
jgi:hypothetical protein